MSVKISVILPVYNKEEYIQECLDTVMGQTLKEIEIICVNDGSTDNSEKVIRKNMEKDERIILENKENGGAASARNRGLEIATGEFVIFMDPDDWYPEEDILETLYETAKREDVLICGGSFSEYSEKKGLVTEFQGVRSKYTFKEDGLMEYKDYQFDYGYHRFIYNLQFLKDNDIFFPLYLRFQDPPFFVKAMITAGRFYALKKIVYRYRAAYQSLNWDERKLSHLLCGLRDNIKMSGEAGLAELHKTTVERLGKAYLNMYAEGIRTNSIEFLQLLIEVDSYIDRDLLRSVDGGEAYVYAISNIIKRAMVLSEKESLEKYEKLKKKLDKIEKSRSYKIGRAITWLPRKLKNRS